MSFKERLKSRKFIVAVGGVVSTIALGFGLNVAPEAVVGVIGAIIVVYEFVQGFVDKEEKKHNDDSNKD